MKISIITPSYNQAVFLEQNIQSILSQGLGDSVEHIVIDGGSTDGSIDILRKYPHLIWKSEKDRGQSHALNKGFKMATGDIIGWINSDDKLTPCALHRVAKFFQENPEEIAVVGNLNLISVGGSFIRIIKGKAYKYEDMVNTNRGVTQGSTFFKRAVFEKIGYLDETLHYAMDFEFFLRMAALATIPYINESLAEFRIQPDAKTTNGLVHFRKEHMKIARKYNASWFSKGIRSDVYVILSEPLRGRPWIRNFIRKLKGIDPYDHERFL